MNEQIGIQVGRKIKAIRMGTGLTQAELARLALKSVETISNFERGKTLPSLLTLEDLAKHLDVQIKDFFDDTPIQRIDHPDEIAIRNKSRLLGAEDKALVIGIIDLLNARSK